MGGAGTAAPALSGAAAPATEAWYAFDTTPVPVKHPSRVRGPDQWCLPGGLVARFGRCAAKVLWFYGFRLAVLIRVAAKPAAFTLRAVWRRAGREVE